MSNTDHRPREVKQQAHKHAGEARAQMDSRRRQDDEGLTGWLNKRAGEWDLSGPDEATMQRQKYLWNTLVDHWFRMEFDGWENLPTHRYCWWASTRVPRSCGMRGRSAFSGGGGSAK